MKLSIDNKIMVKQFESTVFLFMTSDNTRIISCFQLKNENPMCEHPAHQVSVSRIGVLCAQRGCCVKD